MFVQRLASLNLLAYPLIYLPAFREFVIECYHRKRKFTEPWSFLGNYNANTKEQVWNGRSQSNKREHVQDRQKNRGIPERSMLWKYTKLSYRATFYLHFSIISTDLLWWISVYFSKVIHILKNVIIYTCMKVYSIHSEDSRRRFTFHSCQLFPKTSSIIL